MKKYNRIFPGMAFFLIMYAIAVLGIVQEDRTYSSSENRMLQTLPRISKKRVLKGKFQKKYETYLSDQFPARDSWIKVKSAAERLAGKTESNNVYFGKHHYLLEKYTQKDFDKKQGKKNIQALKEFAEKLLQGEEKDSMVNVKVMMVPSKTDILKKELPAFAESYDETIFYEKLEKELPKGVLVPVKEALEKHGKEYIYYRNDHHWTTLGAWYGYEAYLQACDDLGMERLGTEWEDNVKTEENLKEQEEVQETVDKKENIILKKKRALKSVSKNFLGTTYSKVNMYSEMDETFIYEPEGEFSVIYNLGEKTTDSFYEWEYLKKKDQYSVFSGGNQGVLEITRGKEVEKNHLQLHLSLRYHKRQQICRIVRKIVKPCW